MPGTTFRGPRNNRPKVRPVNAPAAVEARSLSEEEGVRSSRVCMGAPRVMFHQFSRPVWLRREVRVAQKVVPMAKHWAPEKREKRRGVRVRRVP